MCLKYFKAKITENRDIFENEESGGKNKYHNFGTMSIHNYTRQQFLTF